jgi:O-antigen ligase
MFALAMLSVLLLEKGMVGAPCFRSTAMDKPIGAVFFLCLVSAIFSMSRADSGEILVLIISYCIIFYCTIDCLRTREDERELVYVICGIGVLLTVIGFCKYAGFTLSFWAYEELGYNKAFLSGTYGNHNHLAGFLEMVIPLLLALFLTRTRKGLTMVLLIGTAIFLVVGHILTLSRGGWFSLGMALTFMFLILMFLKQFKRKKLLVLLFSSCLLLILFVFSGTDLFERVLSFADDETVLGMNGRVMVWQGTLEMIKSHLLLGSGPGTYATIFPQFQPPGSTARFYEAHNDYLHFLAELGIVFLPLLCWWLFCLFRAGRKKLQSTSRQTWGLALGAMAGIVAILFHSFVDFNLLIPANALLFTVLAALVVADRAGLVKGEKMKVEKTKL